MTETRWATAHDQLDIIFFFLIMLDPIKLHCGDVVVVNGKGEEGTACDLDEAQAVSFAFFDRNDGVGD